MKYYVYKDSGKPAPSSDIEINDPNLVEVPRPSSDPYQIWDGEKWTGSEKDLFERYGDFRVMMLGSDGWGRIKQIVANSAPEFLAAVGYMDDNPGVVKYVWNLIINNLPITHQPTTAEIAQWQGIVIATQIGIDWIGDRDDAFDFDDNGSML